MTIASPIGTLVVLAAIAGSLYGAYRHGVTVTDLRWEAKQADHANLHSKALAADTNAKRVEEQRRQIAVNEVSGDARLQNKVLANDASIADAAGRRMHFAARKLAIDSDTCRSDPGAAPRGTSTARAAMVLSELLKRADERAGELARSYDEARLAGLTCEAIYKSVQVTSAN